MKFALKKKRIVESTKLGGHAIGQPILQLENKNTTTKCIHLNTYSV